MLVARRAVDARVAGARDADVPGVLVARRAVDARVAGARDADVPGVFVARRGVLAYLGCLLLGAGC